MNFISILFWTKLKWQILTIYTQGAVLQCWMDHDKHGDSLCWGPLTLHSKLACLKVWGVVSISDRGRDLVVATSIIDARRRCWRPQGQGQKTNKQVTGGHSVLFKPWRTSLLKFYVQSATDTFQITILRCNIILINS